MKWITIFALIIFTFSLYTKAADDDFSEFDIDTSDKSDISDMDVEHTDPVIEKTIDLKDPLNEYTDDEFEGLNEIPKNQKTHDKSPDLKIAKLSQHFMQSWNNYHIELLVMLTLVIYMLNFTVGKAKNYKLAQAWFSAHQSILNENFSIVGDDGISNPNTNSLYKEYEHVYSLWCSGRVSLEAALFEIRLLNRQCLISSLFQFLKPTNDNIVMRFILDENELDKIVLAVGKKKRIQALIKDHIDLSTFCKDKRGHEFKGLHESFVYVSETHDVLAEILTLKVCSTLNAYKDNFEYIYISDQYCGVKASNATAEESSMVHVTKTQNVIEICLKAGNRGQVTEEDMAALADLMTFVFFMIDKISRTRLGSDRKKAEFNRRAIVEAKMKLSHAMRQEAAQARKDEKKRAAKERIMAEEDPEKAKRLAEIEEKKERRKQPKVKMIKSK